MNPLFIAFGRVCLAGLVASFMLFFLKVKRPNGQQFQKLIWVMAGCVIGFPVLTSWALQYVPASHGGVVIGISPLATSVVGVLVGDERPGRAFWGLGILGACVVVIYALREGSGSFHIADLALLAAVLFASIGYAVGGELSKVLGGWQVICWAVLMGLPIAILPAYYLLPASLMDIPFPALGAFFYLALVSQLSAFFIWYRALSLGGVVRVSQLQLLQPFVTALVAVMFLHESMDVTSFGLMCLVVSIVWLGKKMPIRKKEGAEI
jgi:drug/metabolite transporter (DMT)-like permease